MKGEQNTSDTSKIIGQFGVGFYSVFMVADKIEVFTKSFAEDAEELCWTSDGYVIKKKLIFVDVNNIIYNNKIFLSRSGTFEISNADGVQPGTKIVIYLKPDSREFSDENIINRT